MRFELFNYLLSNHKKGLAEAEPFIYQNINPLANMIISHAYECHEDKEKYIKNSSITPLDKGTLELLMREFLHKIDSSNELLSLFDDAIANNKIMYYSDTADKEWVTISKPHDNYIIAPLSGNIRDFVILAHEFFHYYTNVNNSYQSLNSIDSTLEEFPPIFFEYLATLFLSTKGYTFEELSEIVEFRLTDICKSYSRLAVILYTLTENITLTKDNIYPLFGTEISEEIIDNCIDEANGNLLLKEDFIVTKYKYLIGNYLATQAVHNVGYKRLNYMLEVARNLPNINLESLFKKLKVDTSNIKFTNKRKIKKKVK